VVGVLGRGAAAPQNASLIVNGVTQTELKSLLRDANEGLNNLEVFFEARESANESKHFEPVRKLIRAIEIKE
jgi:hypothetical protein